MADPFFQDPNAPVDGGEPVIDKIKVGEDEYSQEDLQKLIGLGKIASEAEEKAHIKIDKVWGNHQKLVNEVRERDQKIAELNDRINQGLQQTQQRQPNQALTPEQIKAEAQKQANELGFGPDSIRKTVLEIVQGQRLLDEAGAVIDTYTADGLPSTTIEDLLQHMQETGIRNPDKAYKDMFEREYLESQAQKLADLKKNTGMPTLDKSVAGSKQPVPQRITNDNLETALAEFLNGASQ